MAGGCVTIIIVQRGTLFLLVVWHDRTRSFVSWIRFSRGPWTSSIRCLDTFISFQNFSKRITHIYVYSQGCFRNVSRMERRFSFLFFSLFRNKIRFRQLDRSSKFEILFVSLGGNNWWQFRWTAPFETSFSLDRANLSFTIQLFEGKYPRLIELCHRTFHEWRAEVCVSGLWRALIPRGFACSPFLNGNVLISTFLFFSFRNCRRAITDGDAIHYYFNFNFNFNFREILTWYAGREMESGDENGSRVSIIRLLKAGWIFTDRCFCPQGARFRDTSQQIHKQWQADPARAFPTVGTVATAGSISPTSGEISTPNSTPSPSPSPTNSQQVAVSSSDPVIDFLSCPSNYYSSKDRRRIWNHDEWNRGPGSTIQKVTWVHKGKPWYDGQFRDSFE